MNFGDNTKVQGIICILTTALLWSFLGFLGKYCLSHGMSPFESAFYRAFFGFSAFFVHGLFSKRENIPSHDRLVLILFGFWGIGCYYAFAQYTILLAGACMDIILQYTAPFWVALFSVLLFRERITFSQSAVLVLAALGTVTVSLSGGSLPEHAPLLGILTGLASGVCYATHFPFMRIWQKRYSSHSIFLYLLGGGTIALFVLNALSISSPLPFSPHPPLVWLSAMFMGIVSTYLAFIFFGLALRRIGLLQAVITTELEPVLSMTWVCLFFGESFSVAGWIGSGLIIASVCVLALLQSKGS